MLEREPEAFVSVSLRRILAGTVGRDDNSSPSKTKPVSGELPTPNSINWIFPIDKYSKLIQNLLHYQSITLYSLLLQNQNQINQDLLLRNIFHIYSIRTLINKYIKYKY